MKTATESLHLTGFDEILEDQELTVSPADYSLLTDLYQLTMAIIPTLAFSLLKVSHPKALNGTDKKSIGAFLGR